MTVVRAKERAVQPEDRAEPPDQQQRSLVGRRQRWLNAWSSVSRVGWGAGRHEASAARDGARRSLLLRLQRAPAQRARAARHPSERGPHTRPTPCSTDMKTAKCCYRCAEAMEHMQPLAPVPAAAAELS